MSRSFVLHEFGKVSAEYVAAYREYLTSRWWAFGFLFTGAAQGLVYHDGGVFIPNLAAGLGWWWSRHRFAHLMGALVLVMAMTQIGAKSVEVYRQAIGQPSLLGGDDDWTILFLFPQCLFGLMCLLAGIGERFGPKP